MLEKLRSRINPLPGHRTQHRRSCSMVRHLTSLPPLNTLANDCSLDKELSARIQSASAAFGRLRERLWNKHNKNARSTVLSSYYVFCTVQRHTRCIDVIFSDCHRYHSIETMLLSRQLIWTCHVVWMNDDRLPKAVLYGELWQAKRNVGRPHLRYRGETTVDLPAY